MTSTPIYSPFPLSYRLTGSKPTRLAVAFTRSSADMSCSGLYRIRSSCQEQMGNRSSVISTCTSEERLQSDARQQLTPLTLCIRPAFKNSFISAISRSKLGDATACGSETSVRSIPKIAVLRFPRG